MSKNKETIGYTLTVAFLVCLVCAVVVSTAAVVLKPMQITNKQLDKNKNVLAAAEMLGSYELSNVPADYVTQTFSKVEVMLVDVQTGKFVTDMSAEEINKYDQAKAAKDPAFSVKLERADDLAQIKRQAKLAKVYVVKNGENIEKVVLPLHGYGLWSTLYGFVALENDFNTIIGLGFYAHLETPGLGGEVDNASWKAQWKGKKVNDQQGQLAVTVTKAGIADLSSDYEIDGLSGATLTTRGVDNLVRYWLGDAGFAKFIANLKAGDA